MPRPPPSVHVIHSSWVPKGIPHVVTHAFHRVRESLADLDARGVHAQTPAVAHACVVKDLIGRIGCRLHAQVWRSAIAKLENCGR